MEWETLGTGAGAGFVSTILTLLGWDRRIRKIEESKVSEGLCVEKHKAVDRLEESLDYIKNRLDRIIDLQLNGKK